MLFLLLDSGDPDSPYCSILYMYEQFIRALCISGASITMKGSERDNGSRVVEKMTIYMTCRCGLVFKLWFPATLESSDLHFSRSKPNNMKYRNREANRAIRSDRMYYCSQHSLKTRQIRSNILELYKLSTA